MKYGDTIKKTRVAHNSTNPRWSQTFVFQLAEQNQPIGFRLMVHIAFKYCIRVRQTTKINEQDKDYEFTAFKIDLNSETDATPKLFKYKFAESSAVSIKIQICNPYDGPEVSAEEVPKELPVWEVDVDKLNCAREIVPKKENEAKAIANPEPEINLDWKTTKMKVKVIGILGMLDSRNRYRSDSFKSS